MSLMSLIPIFISLASFFAYHYLLQPFVLSPLCKIPSAHSTSRISSLWIRYHRRNGSQALLAITKAHAKCGPIVLLSPNEISVASYEGAYKIYIEKGGFAKPKWWAELFTSYGVLNMVSMQGGIGNKQHASRKRDMGNVYAKSYLMGSQELKTIGRAVLSRLRQALDNVVEQDGGVMDVYNFNGGVNADFASRYLFGESGAIDFTLDAKERDAYFQNHGIFLKEKAGAAEAQTWLETFGLKRCDTANKDAIVYRQLTSRGLQGKVLASEMLDHFIAGAEAPRTTITYLQRELSKRPNLQQKLRNEIWNLPSRQGGGNIMDAILDIRALDGLPFLEAVLIETMRFYTPTPGPQYRLTPPEGTVLHGTFIPGGIQISASLAILHHNPKVFPHPDQWKPERWLMDDKEKMEELRRWFWAFNKGSRICIGKDFTMIVMKMIVALIYVSYDTEIVEEDGMEQEDKFLAGPISEKLVLRFRYA